MGKYNLKSKKKQKKYYFLRFGIDKSENMVYNSPAKKLRKGKL